MAENKLSQVLRKIRVPKALMPKKLLTALEVSLSNAAIAFSAAEWLSLFVFAGIFFFIVATVILSPFHGLAMFFSIMALMFIYPNAQAGKRKSAIEASLPDALHHMSVAIRTGLVLESVIKEVSESGYGALSEEFAQVVVEMNRGRSLKDAMLGFAKRSGSKDIQRTMRLVLEGLEFGGPISDVLEEVSVDMKAVQYIQRERKTLTSQQISFLAMACLMSGPFVMGVVASLPVIMQDMAMGAGGMMAFPLDEINKVVSALTFYVAAQAVAGGIMMGVIMFGDMKKGLKFAGPMALIAYIIFRLVQFAMPHALKMF